MDFLDCGGAAIMVGRARCFLLTPGCAACGNRDALGASSASGGPTAATSASGGNSLLGGCMEPSKMPLRAELQRAARGLSSVRQLCQLRNTAMACSSDGADGLLPCSSGVGGCHCAKGSCPSCA